MSLPDEILREIVLKNGLITEEPLKVVLEYAQNTKTSLINTLLENNNIAEEKLGQAIASYYNVPYVDLSKQTIPLEIARIIPDRVARRVKAVAFSRDASEVKIALSDPSDKGILANISKKTGVRAVPYFAFEKNIEGATGLYRKALQKTIDSLLEEYLKQVSTGGEAPISKVVDELILTAYDDRASDIHIEPEEKNSLVRFRVDGVLQDVVKMPPALHERVIARIKVLSNLRTDEHLSAQDGKMQMRLPEEDLDIRVSIIPVAEGEKAVLRLLSSRSREYTLTDLGMNVADLQKTTKAYNKKHKIIPRTIEKPIREKLIDRTEKERAPWVFGSKEPVYESLPHLEIDAMTPMEKKRLIKNLTTEMRLPLKDLFCNHKLEFDFTLDELKIFVSQLNQQAQYQFLRT